MLATDLYASLISVSDLKAKLNASDLDTKDDLIIKFNHLETHGKEAVRCLDDLSVSVGIVVNR